MFNLGACVSSFQIILDRWPIHQQIRREGNKEWEGEGEDKKNIEPVIRVAIHFVH